MPPTSRRSEMLLRGSRPGGARAAGRGSIRTRSFLVEVVDDRARAVPADHDHERLAVGRVLLDVDLAGPDIDEIAGLGLHRLLEAGRTECVACPPGRDPDRRL